MNDYTMVDGAAELEWLSSDLWTGCLGTGCGRNGFEASAVVLHAIWRDPRDETDETHGEREARLRANGELDESGSFSAILASTTLASVGLPAHPERDLVRVRWVDYAREHGGKGDFASRALPSMALTQHESVYPMMDANVVGPDEGSLDELQAGALVSVLLAAFGDQPVFKHTAGQFWFGPQDRPQLMRTTLEALVSTMSAPDTDGTGFGQNVWPDDHAWVTYTDYDSHCTVVSGPRALIDLVLAHPDLEVHRVDVRALSEDLARVRATRAEITGVAPPNQP